MATLTPLHGDCLELMKTLPDKSIDLFVCDLPYGCLTGGAGKEKAKRNAKGDEGVIAGCKWDVPIDLTAFWVEVKRLCKNDHTPVLMFCTTKFGVDLIKSNEDWFRYDLVWSKANAVGFLLANKMPMRSHEMIYVFSKKGANYTRVDITGDFPAGGGGRSKSSYMPSLNEIPNTGKTEAGRRCVKSVVEMSNKKGKGNHPTQKPDDLYEWLITRYSKEGDTILDPTAGSFASCFTAQRLGRNAIGIEMDDGFYEKAVAKTNPSSS
jgi:site-specific DNA-methyltransferase (adenine-specific)